MEFIGIYKLKNFKRMRVSGLNKNGNSSSICENKETEFVHVDTHHFNGNVKNPKCVTLTKYMNRKKNGDRYFASYWQYHISEEEFLNEFEFVRMEDKAEYYK